MRNRGMHNTRAKITIPVYLLLLLALMSLIAGEAYPATAPLTGYVVHFDFITNRYEARQLVHLAASSGARVINIVPPAHIWERRLAVRMLDDILHEAAELKLAVLFTRIDASYPPDVHGRRENYLYKHILTEPGRMPDGSPTVKYFLTTVGRAGYDEWMEEETRYYATRFGKLPNLLGINLGPGRRRRDLHRGPHVGRPTGQLRPPRAAVFWNTCAKPTVMN